MMLGWRLGLAVTSLVASMKLLYAEPVSAEIGDCSRACHLGM